MAKWSARCVQGRKVPSRVSLAPRSSRACLRSPEKRDKITPVAQATSLSFNHRKLYSNSLATVPVRHPRL